MDSYSDECKFKLTGNPSAKYTDPDNKKREYVLDDTEKEHFKDICNEQYSGSASRLIATAQYRNAKDDKKAQLLEDLRDDVLDSTKDEFFRWLRKQGIRNTVKK